MTKKPVILLIENSVDVTGALKSIWNSAHSLRDFYDFIFLIPTNSKAGQWIRHNGSNEVLEMPMREVKKDFGSIVKYFPSLIINTFRLRAIVREKQIDMIHSNDLYNLLPVALQILGVRIPYVTHIRFRPNRFPNWLFNFWLKCHFKYSTKLVAVSNSVLREIKSHHKLVLINDPLPASEAYGSAARLRPADDSKRFLYLSNFINGKGQDLALKAFLRVHLELPGWRLRFVGSDMGMAKNRSFKKKLIALAEEAGVAQKIDWLEFTEDVELEYKQADVILNFSESESFSMTCVEAMFFGKPVIVTDCGGPVEIVDHEISGILVPNKVVDGMAAAMKRLAKNEDLRNRLGQTAKSHVAKKFSFDNTSFKLKVIFDTALSDKT